LINKIFQQLDAGFPAFFRVKLGTDNIALLNTAYKFIVVMGGGQRDGWILRYDVIRVYKVKFCIRLYPFENRRIFFQVYPVPSNVRYSQAGGEPFDVSLEQSHTVIA